MRACRREGWKAVKLLPSERGVPDRMVMTSGGGIWLVELKTEKGRLSKAQELWHSRAAKLGTKVFVAYGRAEVDGWIARTRAAVEGQNLL
ncbi:VRR-NUC domain-containing protein [Rothia mucilaginosa]|uniref:VRR-NUC domain-containing protein n=1 Tax=Rothia mucilaginosa TaxID=43675 RepID=UPI003C7DAA8A